MQSVAMVGRRDFGSYCRADANGDSRALLVSNIGWGVPPLYWRALSSMNAISGLSYRLLATQSSTFPWMAIVLADSFSVYGLLKRYVPLDAAQATTFEAEAVVPLALLWLAFQPRFGLPAPLTWPVALLLVLQVWPPRYRWSRSRTACSTAIT